MCSHHHVTDYRTPFSYLVFPLAIGLGLVHIGCRHPSTSPARGDDRLQHETKQHVSPPKPPSSVRRTVEVSEPSRQEGHAEGQISSLLTQLGADSWTKREAAHKQLVQLGKTRTSSLLQQTLDTLLLSNDPEVAYRTRQILESVVTTDVYKDGFVGIQITPMTSTVTLKGLVVHPMRIDRVIPNTAAATYGLRAGDLIMQTDAHVSSSEFGVPEFINYVSSKGPGAKLVLSLWSEGKEVTKEIVVGRRPDDLQGDPPSDVRKRAFFLSWLKSNTMTTNKQMQSRQRGTERE